MTMPKHTRLSESQIGKIKKLYRRGVKPSSIARELHVTPAAVRYHLIKEKLINDIDRTGYLLPDEIVAIVDTYASGSGLRATAALTGQPFATVYQLLHQRGQIRHGGKTRS